MTHSNNELVSQFLRDVFGFDIGGALNGNAHDLSDVTLHMFVDKYPDFEIHKVTHDFYKYAEKKIDDAIEKETEELSKFYVKRAAIFTIKGDYGRAEHDYRKAYDIYPSDELRTRVNNFLRASKSLSTHL